MSHTDVARLFLIVVLILSGGCRSSSPEPPTSPVTSAESKDQQQADTHSSVSEVEMADSNGAVGESDLYAAGFISKSNYEKSSWSKRLLIALADNGPVLIELSAGIDGQHLQDAWDAKIDETIDALLKGVAETDGDDTSAAASKAISIEWRRLLTHPLIRSGWLGNLLSDESQMDGVLASYDLDFDERVSREEVAAFLSQGLSPGQLIRVSDLGEEETAGTNSPWGKLDSNQDFVLDAQEQGEVAEILRSLDVNGDGIVASREGQPTNSMVARSDGMNQSSFFDTTTLLVADAVPEDAGTAHVRDSQRRLSQSLLNHYAIDNALPNARWSTWAESRWKILDVDGNQLLSSRELKRITEVEPEFRIVLKLPGLAWQEELLSGMEEKPELLGLARAEDFGPSANVAELEKASTSAPPEKMDLKWISNGRTARLQTAEFIADVAVEDLFSSGGRDQLRQRLSAALADPQLQVFLRDQLELSEDAFTLLDRNEDQSLSDEEFERAWSWLTLRQGSRIVVRWMKAAQPWFRLLDDDGDGRLTGPEIALAGQKLSSFDADEDGRLTTRELPLIVSVQIQRTDDRLEAFSFPAPSEANGEVVDDWFSAMDSNRDALISSREFLGDRDDFEDLDKDKDGFLSRQEVY